MNNPTIKERPILFSGAMVRAILAGTKTQTRRVVKWPVKSTTHHISINESDQGPIAAWCPYGQPGDRLWVRETWAAHYINLGIKPSELTFGEGRCVFYKADESVRGGCSFCARESKWRPSIFMPRDASRLLLEITAVRCERLQDISEADAVAEGIQSRIAGLENFGARARGMKLYRDYERKENSLTDKRGTGFAEPTASYETLWASINGPDSWAANPWVWVVEFKVVSKDGKEAASVA